MHRTTGSPIGRVSSLDRDELDRSDRSSTLPVYGGGELPDAIVKNR